MSLPTSMPSHVSAHSAELVRRGSTATNRAPLRTPRSRWWKKIGCVSRAFEPHRMTRSVSSVSRYEEVPPPAPNTVARPTTLGACQVRLQLSTLLLPITTRVNFWAMKFISFVVLEQLNMPKALAPPVRAWANPAAARSRASSQLAGRNRPPSLTRGSVRRRRPSSILGSRVIQGNGCDWPAVPSGDARPARATHSEQAGPEARPVGAHAHSALLDHARDPVRGQPHPQQPAGLVRPAADRDDPLQRVHPADH